jgi:glycine oxidase
LNISYEVIVVGGGAIGAACARELARAGRKVLVLERGTDEGASWRAAAGMLAPQIEAAEDDPLFPLGLAGRDRYAGLARELEACTGIAIQYWRKGIARLAIEENDVGPLQSRVAWQRARGIEAEWLSEGEVRVRWPWLGPNHGALWAPREAALDPSRLVSALLEDAKRAGAEILTESVRGIERKGDRATGVVGSSKTYLAEEIVIAAGAWGSRLEGLPRPIPVVPVRGQMAAFPWPAGLPPAIVYGSHVYVVARANEAIAGSTMEHAGFHPEVTAEGIHAIVTGARALLPALATAKVSRTWAGLRPVTPDGCPIVGKEPMVEGLWYATGHGRNGILLAAITGILLTQLMSGHPAEHDVHPMRPERFFRW